DGIATFDVMVKDGQIYLATEPNDALAPGLAPTPRAQSGNADHYPYAIIGGGIAAANAVYGIREYDRESPIVLITSEDLPPYDRTHVSKALMAGGKESVGDLVLHSEQFYRERGVTLLEKTVAERVQVQEKRIITAAGREITYDKILLATGGKPRQLSGAAGQNVFTIRNAADGAAVRELTGEGTKVVIIGGSFIGLETAMSLGKQGGHITVVAPEEILLQGPYGEHVGKYVQQLHEAAGVHFKLGRKAKSFYDEKGKVNTVVLDNGEELAADLVVVGIGVQPATGYLEGLVANKDGGISVDNHLAANVADTWVAGDIAQYPDREGAVRIEHWKVAAQQGRVAGRNMAGAAEAYTMLPYFWSNQQGVNFRYAGHATDYDRVIFDGIPGEGPFLAFYVKDEHVQAVLGVKRDRDTAVVADRMSAGEMPPVAELKGYAW
ncbi:MAG: FAD-dependent oxidoreductase, partial [Bacteroidota bacterium]